ncbi:zinc finger domain-containing protein [Streptomyces sp. enrichment culture]|uniref:zinc finger domain-containing protein n=1 Tax=Streptomyces sp. enrichment culture TaxID=1795815 RepID=UPI003F57CB62
MSTTPGQPPAEKASDAPALRLRAITVACPLCGAQPGDLCTSHGGTRQRREDVHRIRARAAAETRLAVVDGRDALAFVVIRPAEEDPERIAVEASARGMGKAAAAYALRRTADQFDAVARAEGDEPIPYPAVEEPVDTFADTDETPEAAARRFARRLAAVERLCSGRPGYHTITVKALLTAMSEADDDQADETAPHPLSEAMRAAGRMAAEGAARGIRRAQQHPHPFGEAFAEFGRKLREAAEQAAANAQQAAEEEPATPAEGDQYIKREAPDEGRVVTVERVWTADDGHTAVAYEWRDDKPGQSFSACPLDVFHRTYAPATEPADQ